MFDYIRPYTYGGGFFMMLLMWLPVLVLLFVLIRFLGENNKDNKRDNKKTTDALDILKERYAKGEIDKKQFQEMKKDLE